MKVLYTTDYKAPAERKYWGYVVKHPDESILEAVNAYSIGGYSETLKDAKKGTASDDECYHVCVTYMDDELIKITGEKHE